ncbi:hypothetical protein GDO78_021614 [Eleutherodactylus coqui]|uniref:Uncharacterized protein n=1 Tax=Eleutherodactylus coqui TaxID=57060 RepID=A0A8J6BDK5_ELECQ|nr:hypothetical protein GDO78_021614 [Eleutherodactylus coqui]
MLHLLFPRRNAGSTWLCRDRLAALCGREFCKFSSTWLANPGISGCRWICCSETPQQGNSAANPSRVNLAPSPLLTTLLLRLG